MDIIMEARFFGVFLSVLGIGMFLNRNHIKSILSDVTQNRGVLFIVGFLSLFVGSHLVTTHTEWASDWTVAFPVLGWLLIFASVMRLWFPDVIIKKFQGHGDVIANVAQVWALLVALTGFMFLYYGYMYMG